MHGDTELKRCVRSVMETAILFYAHAKTDDERARAVNMAVEYIVGIVMDTELKLADIERAAAEASEQGYSDGLWRAREAVIKAVDAVVGIDEEHL